MFTIDKSQHVQIHFANLASAAEFLPEINARVADTRCGALFPKRASLIDRVDGDFIGAIVLHSPEKGMDSTVTVMIRPDRVRL